MTSTTPLGPRREAFQSQTAYDNAVDRWNESAGRGRQPEAAPNLPPEEVSVVFDLFTGLIKLTHTGTGLFWEDKYDPRTLTAQHRRLARIVCDHRAKLALLPVPAPVTWCGLDLTLLQEAPARIVPARMPSGRTFPEIAYKCGIVAADEEVEAFAAWILRDRPVAAAQPKSAPAPQVVEVLPLLIEMREALQALDDLGPRVSGWQSPDRLSLLQRSAAAISFWRP